jgi:hypothetical protein
MSVVDGIDKLMSGGVENLPELLRFLKKNEYEFVPFDCWVVWACRPNDENPEWHKQWNLSVFRTQEEAEARCQELNKQWRDDQEQHPWWGPWEETGLHAFAEHRTEVRLCYLRPFIEGKDE